MNLNLIDRNGFKVLSIATGSKCLSEKQMPFNGKVHIRFQKFKII
jgi:hypothetical protein